ncbi:hypothetical protein FBZ92_112123 [Nitrospirillum viridazoti]|uniref:NACHT domain-containing protein n=2 Tax=Nitrospirillum TaxID=1543705 RepID=A0A560IGX8_9PROT|nr:hypothetical protein FBZ92_112123 [Nitrospirillum amazonense]
MGKSTLLKYIYITCVRGAHLAPIHIDLRKLTGDTEILDFIFNDIKGFSEDENRSHLSKSIIDGGFLFLLDGFDEVARDQKSHVLENITKFIGIAKNNKYIITSRPEDALSHFIDFESFCISSLSSDESKELIKKYDQNGEISSELIAELEKDGMSELKEFLTNPLLTSLLYKAYAYKKTIPTKKYVFYRQVYDALYESHDLTKGGAFRREKCSSLDVEDFHKAMRFIGYMSMKEGKTEYSRDEIVDIIKKAADICNDLKIIPSLILDDLIHSVPLFVIDGNNYRWSHKSLQDYFSACFIWVDSGNSKEEIIEKMSSSRQISRYDNILDIYYDLDKSTFNRVITLSIIKEFIFHYENSYGQKYKSGISQSMIDIRKSVTFGAYIIVYNNDSDYGKASNIFKNIFGSFHFPDLLVKQDESSEDDEFTNTLTDGFQFFGAAFSKNCVLFFARNNYRVILDILSSKDVPIFKNLPKRDSLKSPRISKKMIPSKMNDDAGSFFNRPDIFQTFSYMLSLPGRRAMDYEKCKSYMRLIEKDIEISPNKSLISGL